MILAQLCYAHPSLILNFFILYEVMHNNFMYEVFFILENQNPRQVLFLQIEEWLQIETLSLIMLQVPT